MASEQSEALRRVLNEMEAVRKRSLLVTRLTIYPSVVFFTAGTIMLLFSPNKWLGLTFGIISLFGCIGAVGVNVSGSVLCNTQRILKAIEILSQKVEAASK